MSQSDSRITFNLLERARPSSLSVGVFLFQIENGRSHSMSMCEEIHDFPRSTVKVDMNAVGYRTHDQCKHKPEGITPDGDCYLIYIWQVVTSRRCCLCRRRFFAGRKHAGRHRGVQQVLAAGSRRRERRGAFACFVQPGEIVLAAVLTVGVCSASVNTVV